MQNLMPAETRKVAASAEGQGLRFIEVKDPNAFLVSPQMRALTTQQVFVLSEEGAEELFEELRWANTNGRPSCPRCGCLDLYARRARLLWKCKSCEHEFSATSGTIFSAKKARFKTLLLAAIALMNNREQRNQSEAARASGMRQESANALSKKLRRLSLTTAINHVKLADHKFSLDRPRYHGGAWLSTRTWWTDPEKAALKNFSDSGAPLDKVADALGRDPKSIAWFARDLIGPSIMPSEWKALIAPKKKPKLIIEPRMAYPYVRKARPSDADLLKVNDLVPKNLPEWIRADVCQSIMLALYDGSVELADLEVNKAKVYWFIRKFYKEQMPREEVSLEGRIGDDRDTYEIAAARTYDGAVTVDEETAQRQSMYRSSLFNRWSQPTQVETVYRNEIKRAVSLMPLKQRRVFELMMDGNGSVDIGLKLRLKPEAVLKRLREGGHLLWQSGLIEMQSDVGR